MGKIADDLIPNKKYAKISDRLFDSWPILDLILISRLMDKYLTIRHDKINDKSVNQNNK